MSSDPSGTYISEDQTDVAAPNERTDTVTLCQLVTERGPLTPTLCTSDVEFLKIFGGYTPDNLDSIASMKLYFDEGGKLLIVGRVVHHTDATDATTATCAKGTLTLATSSLVAGSGTVLGATQAPFNLEPGDTLVVSVDGGGNATATFTAVAAARVSTGAAPFALANADVLSVAIDGGSTQAITFTTGQFANIAQATAAEVAAAINGQIVDAQAYVSGSNVGIRSDKRGTGSSVNVIAGGAQAVGKLNITAGAITGTGNVANIDAVTNAEVKTIVELAVAGCTVSNTNGYPRITSNTTGGSSSVQVIASSTADDELGLDNAIHTGNAAGAADTLRIDGKTPGTYANSLRMVVSAPTSGQAGRFNLAVLRAGVTVEFWRDLTMVTTDPRYAPRIINGTSSEGSDLIAAVDLSAAVAYPANVPNLGTFGPLTGGNDGLASLADADFIGGASSTGKVGLRVFDTQDGDVLISPQRATPAVHNAMLTYCTVTRGGKIKPIFETPAGKTGAEIIDYVTNVAGVKDLSDFGSIDWPRIKVTNPNKTLYGDDELVVAPVSAARAGVIARVGAAKEWGAFDQPGGPANDYTLRTARGLETEEVLDDSVRGRVFDANINPITRKRSKAPGTLAAWGPIYFDGTRNLRRSGPWPSMGQRIGVSWVKKQIDALLDPTRIRNLSDDLITQIRDKIYAFLSSGTKAGAFASKDPAKAFIVDYGPGLNTASTKRDGKNFGRVGMATTNANEFNFLSIGPDNRELNAQLASEQ